MKVMDGKQKKVLERQNQNDEREMQRKTERISSVKQIILNGALKVEKYEKEKQATTGTKNVELEEPGKLRNSSPVFGGNSVFPKKVTPIIMSQYKNNPIGVPTPKSSLESKTRLSTKETEKVYLSSAKPKSRFIRKRINNAKQAKPTRSVSPMIKREKQQIVRGKSASYKSKIVKVNRIQYPPEIVEMNKFDILEQNEQKILEQNRRENLKKEQIKEMSKYKPIYKAVDPSMIKKESPHENPKTTAEGVKSKGARPGQAKTQNQISQSVFQPNQAQVKNSGLFYSNVNFSQTENTVKK